MSQKKSERVRTDDVAEDEKEALLKADSLTLSEDEALIMISTATKNVSPISTSSSTPVLGSHASISRSSKHTVSLDFGAEPRSSVSTQLNSLSSVSMFSQSSSGFREPWERESKGFSNSFSMSSAFSDDSQRPFECTFCLERCIGQEDWKRHEQLQHFPQTEWICMPWGPTEKASDGHDVCVFCDAINPDSSHRSQHKDQPCYSLPTADRTYMKKTDLQEHLSTVHNHQLEMTQYMQEWWWPPKDNAWYWNCGFCDVLLTSWNDRAEHIGNHFLEGKDMSTWDPLLLPHPLDKETLTCATWFPRLSWDAGTLLTLQLEQRNPVGR
jgi:hypothetical protein